MGRAFVPQRIRWYKDSAHVVFPGDDSQSTFGWCQRTHYWDADRTRRLPLTSPEWILLLDGEVQDTSLKNLAEVKCLIIRLAYNIYNNFAIPSELLSAAGLCYNDSFWLDSWNLLEDRKLRYIVEVDKSFSIPPERRLKLDQERRMPLRPVAKPKKKASTPCRKIGFWDEVSSWISAAGTDDYGLTDEECTIYLD